MFAGDALRLRNVIALADGFIATGCTVTAGSECDQAIVVVSPDATTWTTTDIGPGGDLFSPSLRQADGRLFALSYGGFGTRGGALVWTSVDGRTWSSVDSASFENRSVDDIIESPSGVFAVGHEAPYASDNTSGFVVWPVRDDGSFGEPRSIDLGPDQKILGGAIWTGTEYLA